MKKLTSTLLAFIFLFSSCSEKMVKVISSSTPQRVESSREIISVKDYKIKSQNQFEFIINKEEEVKYATTYEEKQKWHNPNPYSWYPILAGASGYGTYKLLENAGDNLPWGIALGTVTFGFVYMMFTEPINPVKTVTKNGKPIITTENIKASDEIIITKIENQEKRGSTDNSGMLNINPFDYKFPVLKNHQDFKLTFSKGEFQNFETASINSSWWMKEYGIINKDPVSLLGDLNSSSFPRNGLLGAGSSIVDKQKGRFLLKLNMDAWIQPQDLNIYYYSSPKEIGIIPALKSLDYKINNHRIVEKQKQIIESEINN